MGKAKNSLRNPANERRRDNKKTVQPCEESVVDHKQALVGAMNTLGYGFQNVIALLDA